VAVVTKGGEGYSLDEKYQVEVHNFLLVFATMIAVNFVH
jgi:hypothetical protein